MEKHIRKLYKQITNYNFNIYICVYISVTFFLLIYKCYLKRKK